MGFGDNRNRKNLGRCRREIRWIKGSMVGRFDSVLYQYRDTFWTIKPEVGEIT